MDSKAAQSFFFLTERTCYGFTLKPFCMAHSAYLEAIGSPLVCGGDATVSDLVIAAQVCAAHPGGFALRFEMLSDEQLAAFNEDDERERFRAYLDEGRQSPDLKDFEGGAGRGAWRAPWQFAIVAYLIRHSTITRQEAWYMPEGEALWYFYTVEEQETGKSRIYSEEEQHEDEELKAENERNAPMHERRCRNLALKHQGRWPAGAPFDIDVELAPEIYAQLEGPKDV